MSCPVFWMPGLICDAFLLCFDVWDLFKKTHAERSWILAALRPPDLSPRPDWWPKRWMVWTPPMSIKLILISLVALPRQYLCFEPLWTLAASVSGLPASFFCILSRLAFLSLQVYLWAFPACVVHRGYQAIRSGSANWLTIEWTAKCLMKSPYFCTLCALM